MLLLTVKEKWKMELLLKNNWDQTYMEIAQVIAKQSRANRKKVGSVLVYENQIISFGYNGTAPNMDNSCEDPATSETLKSVIHSEINTIAKCAANGIKTKGATLYITFSPCMNCALLLIQAQIKRVVYLDTHSDQSGLDLMRLQGIKIDKLCQTN